MSHVVPDVLCDLCRSLFNYRASWQSRIARSADALPIDLADGWRPHLCLKALKASAGNGCHFYSKIWFSIEDGLARDIPDFRPGEMTLDEREHFKADDSQPWVRIFDGNGYHPYVMEVASPYSGEDRVLRPPSSYFREARDQAVMDANKRTLTTDFTSPATLKQIRKWQRECERAHNACRLSLIPDSCHHFLPTRFLRVTRSAIYLTYSDAITVDEVVSYVTLSHRWGSRICFQLTHANLDELRAGVELTALPLLFRDAAWLAYELGYRYLWIDSLCIVQGDFEDWTRESAQMCENYAGSSLNIAASVALHSDESMFRAPRNLLKVLDCNIKATWQCFKPKSLSCDTINYGDPLRKLPLNRRTCVLQERLLAPKTIHFGNDQVYWECGNVGMVLLLSHILKVLFATKLGICSDPGFA
jgi:hypothetical protein